MKNYPHLSARVLNTPLLVEPGYARVFFSALASRLGIVQLSDAEGEILTGEKLQVDLGSFGGRRDQEKSRSYPVYNGVAVLPVSGSLVHKSGHLNPYSGMTGYDGIIARAANAFADPDVKGVLMDKDTPGGEVSGCFDTSRTLRQLADASGKELWSLCHDMHCSAGMALASAAHRRLITQTGVAGSVGVVMAHTNYAKMLGENGVEVTLIHSGQHKVDGNPYEQLSAEVLAKFQAGTDNIRQMFAQLMADHMGLSVEEILATEAATFTGQAAVDVGFADELINGNEAIHYFSEYLAGRGQTITIGSKTMDEGNKPAEGTEHKSLADQSGTTQVAEQPPVNSEAQQPASTPAAQQSAAVPVDTGAADAAAAMQARIGGILQAEEAKGCKETANYLAFNTNLTKEEAIGVMATIPAAPASNQMNTALDKLMANEQQPDIDADAGDAPAGNALLASYEKATGDKG
ncbi:S49 family peptidase [Oceanospirillum beijerinckii]|uniref:S49 family peptidase n=1 Tax=Oceanospirillum beijerinckii TaxID=64976 RepID=UPI0003F6619F|nr:S49 family peptidase [Oceanospirillum beijerinckii]